MHPTASSRSPFFGLNNACLTTLTNKWLQMQRKSCYDLSVMQQTPSLLQPLPLTGLPPAIAQSIVDHVRKLQLHYGSKLSESADDDAIDHPVLVGDAWLAAFDRFASSGPTSVADDSREAIYDDSQER